MATRDADRLRQIRSFPQLVKYLRDELDWPIEQEDFDELTFDWNPQELGIDAKSAAKIEEIKQLRPLESDQPWGIFFVKFEPKQLPVVALRRVLGQLAVKKRASANRADQRVWRADDLLFISAYGEGGDRQLAFAHFAAPENERDLPTLRVLGWDSDDTALKLDHIARTLDENLAWPQDPGDVGAWRARWSSAFVLRPREVIRTAKELAVRLADLAKVIRKRAEQLLKLESDRGPLRKLHAAFEEALIHDLTESDFADMYAQTITYGLFSAAVTGEGIGGRGVLIAEDVATGVPITNPFLRELLGSFLTAGGRKQGLDFDELGVQDVVELLRSPDTHLDDILRDFGNKSRDEDPVIHFYESFLREYDRKRKVERGVFYTPQPVVSYIVRSVHDILRTEFGLEDGLASTVTWGEMVERHPGLTLPQDTSAASPFVTILDPATGTATFLVEVIDLIHRTLVERWKGDGVGARERAERWNVYVPEHLLPRLFGYELMMAPYAIAHMKIGLKLLETGYRFASEGRARVYLTNALEPAQDFSDRLAFDVPALAHEARAVNEVKQRQRFTVLMGNPPYSGISANRGDWIESLIDDYRTVDGKPLGEKKVWLRDDYVKFIRLAELAIDRSAVGVVGLITNNSFFDSLTFRGFRAHILRSFDNALFVNLHGNANLKEKAPDGTPDENVFEILQGVGISLLSRRPAGQTTRSTVLTADLYGLRKVKYERLLAASAQEVGARALDPGPPNYFFVFKNLAGRADYERFTRVTDLFNVGGLGFQSHRDSFVVAFSREELVDRMQQFFDLTVSDEDVKARFGISDYERFSVSRYRREHRFDPEAIRCIQYRPFDYRYVYYADGIIQRWLIRVHGHMLKPNRGLNVMRQTKAPEWRHVMVADSPTPAVFVEIKDGSSQYPLYLYPDVEESLFTPHVGREPNLNTSVVSEWTSRLGVVPAWDDDSRLEEQLSPEEIFDYVYAVLYSTAYRQLYAEFLKIDFPRVPLRGRIDVLHSLGRLGSELVALHLMQSPRLDEVIAPYVGPRSPEVLRPGWSDDTVWLDASARGRGGSGRSGTIGFHGVSEDVWSFHIGGYQVCEKWLKDRKGRTLTTDDIRHYQRIIAALHETIRIMDEIDGVIESYGGWPGAFELD